MVEFDMVKFVILLLMGPFIKFDCSRYQCSNIWKIGGTFK
jgi:hypothetical protein